VAMLGTREVRTEFWWGDLRESNHSEDLGVDVRVVIKCIFKNWDGEVWTGLMRSGIGTGGRLLFMR